MADIENTSSEALESTSEAIENTSSEVIETQETPTLDIESIVLEALKNPTESIQKHINEVVQNEVKKQVQAMLKGATPKKSAGNNTIITKSDFSKMTYQQRNDLFNQNRELYNELTK